MAARNESDVRSAILKVLAVLVLLAAGAATVVASWLQAVGRCAVAEAPAADSATRLVPGCRSLTPDALIFLYKNHGHVWMPLAGVALMVVAIMLAYALMSAPGRVLRVVLAVQAVAAVAFVAINLAAHGRGSDAASAVVIALIPLVLCGIPVVAFRRRDDRWLWMLPLEAAIVAMCVGTTVYLLQRAS
jgi:hypothetical protein